MDLSEQHRDEVDALEQMTDEDIDFSEIPEVSNLSDVIHGAYHQLRTGARSPRRTDVTEKGLEALIESALIDRYWLPGSPEDYLRAECVDLSNLQAFLEATQPEIAADLALDTDTPTRRRFLDRLKREVANRGIIDILRNGLRHGPHDVTLFYGTPTPGNTLAQERYLQNRFSVTRQLRYSNDTRQRSLDIVLFINGLPIATMELKNRFTGQNVADAVHQYQTTRPAAEDLFRQGRCAVHFALDDEEVRFCTALANRASVFLPFNKGRDGGAGNPVNPNGIKTAYLWEETLTPDGLTDIIENYAQKADNSQIWPRYHQLDVVRQALADAREKGAGEKYLIQHSAGSGKSNSIAWLSRQLITLSRNGRTVFDSIIVITDRVVLDSQINRTIRQFTQVASTVGHADSSGDLRRFIEEGKKIIITTVQKFPFILDDIGRDHQDKSFAIIIDEAHSSQGGKTAIAMNTALGGNSEPIEDEDDYEDEVNRIIESRRMLTNASYFAFTATPKNRTLELFGKPDPKPEGAVRHLPFHTYSMKQAIEEGFILDVLTNYTPINSYYNIIKKTEEDPEFDAKRAQRKLRRYVENHEYAIETKAEIILDHFQESVVLSNKMGSQARAMLVTDGVDRAISYYHAIRDLIAQRGYSYKALVAFSGTRDFNGEEVSEAKLNGVPEIRTAERFQNDPYRILICADKFQTGYDEPLLHTMYVDKTLSGIKAVQTLSRLNRFHPKKSETFVLDFMNSTDAIQESFADYYKTTILADETDPDKLHDLKAGLDQAQVYSHEEIEDLVHRYLGGEDRPTLDPILGPCVDRYLEMEEDQQVSFKGSAKSFNRLYAFLSQILPYGNPEWEKLSIFLNFLVPKLPAPVEPDLSLGILEAIDMDTYRAEKQATIGIQLEDEDALIDPIQVERGGGIQEPLLEPLSLIVDEFNKIYGPGFSDPDYISEAIKTMPERVNNDDAYRNAKRNSPKQNAAVESNAAMRRVIGSMLRSHTELFRKYTEDEDFKEWLNRQIFEVSYGMDENGTTIP